MAGREDEGGLTRGGAAGKREVSAAFNEVDSTPLLFSASPFRHPGSKYRLLITVIHHERPVKQEQTY